MREKLRDIAFGFVFAGVVIVCVIRTLVSFIAYVLFPPPRKEVGNVRIRVS